MIVRESLAFDALISIGDLSKVNTNFRKFTNHIFHELRKELGPYVAAGMLEMEEELKAMFDEGFTGEQVIATLKKLDLSGYNFREKKFNKAGFFRESVEDTFQPKDLSLVYAHKKYGEENVNEFIRDVFKLVNIKMLFRPLALSEFIKDEAIVKELVQGLVKKENPFTTSERIKTYMKGQGHYIK